MEQEEKKDSKKIIVILSIVIFLLILAFASYIIYEKYQENLAQERQALLENTKQKYESINSDIEKLILTEEEQKEINEQIEKVKSYCRSQEYNINDIDGVRAEFNNGWALVRASNTSPNITARFEGRTKEDMEKIQREFMSLLK